MKINVQKLMTPNMRKELAYSYYVLFLEGKFSEPLAIINQVEMDRLIADIKVEQMK